MTVDQPRRLLLLTATVTPHPRMGALAVTNADERYEQYCDAFRFLVSSGATALFDRILVCENSGFDLHRFEEAFAGSLAEVSFVPVQMDPSAGEYGRGYSEMLLIDTALKLVGETVGEGDRVWKLTGRYRIKNLARVITTSSHVDDLVVTLRKHPSRWADLFLFSFNRRSWRAVAAHLDDLKSASGSAVMYDIIDRIPGEGVTVATRLGTEPHLLGVRGHDKRNYDSTRQHLKRHARQLIHLVAPGLRI